jgi:hypothetical protein
MVGVDGISNTNQVYKVSSGGAAPNQDEFAGQPIAKLPDGGTNALAQVVLRSNPVSVEPRSVGEILSEPPSRGGFSRVEGTTLIVGAGQYETIEECRSRVVQLVNQEQQRVNDATPWFQKPKSIYTDAIIYGPLQDITRDGKVVGANRREPIKLSFGNEGGSSFVKAVDATKQAFAKAGDFLTDTKKKATSIAEEVRRNPAEKLGLNALDRKAGETVEAIGTAAMFGGVGGMVSASDAGVLPTQSGSSLSGMVKEGVGIIKEEFRPVTPEQKAMNEANNKIYRERLKEQNQFLRENGLND